MKNKKTIPELIQILEAANQDSDFAAICGDCIPALKLPKTAWERYVDGRIQPSWVGRKAIFKWLLAKAKYCEQI